MVTGRGKSVFWYEVIFQQILSTMVGIFLGQLQQVSGWYKHLNHPSNVHTH
jgi:hypothetical protein